MKNCRRLLMAMIAVCQVVLQDGLFVPALAAPTSPRIPVIDVTDRYHPHQDAGDNIDLVTAYALPELDLRAVLLDCTEPFRQPVATNPQVGLFPDPDGLREPGFIPVLQLNHGVFNAPKACH